MNDLLGTAIGVLITSSAAMFWGFEYRSDHQMQAVGALFGSVDQTWQLAGWAINLGIPGFLIGIALLIGGLVRMPQSPPAGRSRKPSSARPSGEGGDR